MTTPRTLHPIFDQHPIAAVAFDLHDTLVGYPNIDRFLAHEIPSRCPSLDPKHIAASGATASTMNPPGRSTGASTTPRPRTPPPHYLSAKCGPNASASAASPNPPSPPSSKPGHPSCPRPPPRRRRRHRPHPRPTVSVAIVSNGDTDYVNAAVVAAPFHVTAVIPSQAAGAPKPTGHIFRLTAERLGVHPAAILFIGDSPRHDMDGARAAGMHPVWKRPNPHSPWPREWRPRLTIDSVSALAPPRPHPITTHPPPTARALRLTPDRIVLTPQGGVPRLTRCPLGWSGERSLACRSETLLSQ